MAMSQSKAGRTIGAVRRSGAGAKRTTALRVGTVGPAKTEPVMIPVRAKTFKALAGQPGPMTVLIESYGAALEQSRLSGRAVRFVVAVDPHGKPRITPIEGRSELPEAQSTEGEDDLAAALEAARARGRLRVAEILSGADMLSADQFADLIGTSRVTVNAKRQKHQVLGLEGAKRGFRFPEWQVGQDGKPFTALPVLFERLGGSPWAVYRFLVQHHPELNGQTGRQALQRGRTAEVIEAAESVVRDFS
jgi:hypothetical protein